MAGEVERLYRARSGPATGLPEPLLWTVASSLHEFCAILIAHEVTLLQNSSLLKAGSDYTTTLGQEALECLR